MKKLKWSRNGFGCEILHFTKIFASQFREMDDKLPGLYMKDVEMFLENNFIFSDFQYVSCFF